MTSGFFSSTFVRSLAFRVLLFLTLALLPIGLIALVQTREISQQSVINAELSLLAVTEQASRRERILLQEAFGAAQALSTVIRLKIGDETECDEFLADYQRFSRRYSVIGFVDAAGDMQCSSVDEDTQLRQADRIRKASAQPRRLAYAAGATSASDKPVIVVSHPSKQNGELIGFTTMLLPKALFRPESGISEDLRPLELITFNMDGEFLTSEGPEDTAQTLLPEGVALASLPIGRGRVFEGTSKTGVDHVYAVLPLVPGIAYAIGVWPVDTPLLQTDVSSALSAFLPVAMWIASLVVAFWALNRLAVRHIRKLGRQMRRFALNRTLPNQSLGSGLPTEILEMETAFVNMAESILREEAALEDSLRQKNILLKEVHHRVKNNLQLISSIMNMQIREAKSSESRAVLQRLQDRILSLATVHKNLYQNEELERVNGGELIKDIVNQILAVGLSGGHKVTVEQDYAPVPLDADDAAPLTLLAAEAVTNALKYVAEAGEGGAKISIKLTLNAGSRACLSVSNTVSPDRHSEADPGTGLGSRLISAFARQLNAQVNAREEEGLYIFEVDFPVSQHAKQVYDY